MITFEHWSDGDTPSIHAKIVLKHNGRTMPSCERMSATL